MKAILKYYINGSSEKIKIPKDFKVLALQHQALNICFWALVEKTNTIETYLFETVGTGWERQDNFEGMEYVGTFQDESFVWHIFYRKL
jgi:hypothetical protein